MSSQLSGNEGRVNKPRDQRTSPAGAVGPKVVQDGSPQSGVRSARFVDNDHASGGLPQDQATADQGDRSRRSMWKRLTGSPLRKLLAALGAIVTAVVVTVITSIVTGLLAGGKSTKMVLTQPVFFQPWIGSGHISSDNHIASTVKGSCWEGSIVSTRSDAFRCIEGDVILDPCFANPYDGYLSGMVACPIPSPDSITLINLTKRLPRISAASAGSRNVWLIILANGERCFRASEMFITPGGLRNNYKCRTGDLYGNLQHTGHTWTIFEQRHGSPNMTLVPVAKAYS